jgi:hypothetical protein
MIKAPPHITPKRGVKAMEELGRQSRRQVIS